MTRRFGDGSVAVDDGCGPRHGVGAIRARTLRSGSLPRCTRSVGAQVPGVVDGAGHGDGVAACGGDDSSSEDFGSPSNSDDDGGDDGGNDGSAGAFDLDFGGSDDEDLSNEDVIEVIQQFWEDNAADFNSDYEPLPDERIGAVPGDQTLVCQGFDITPDQVAMNAFAAPCPEGLTVAWDPALIDDTLTGLFGGAGPAVVFAHEWGHVMQFQSGVLDITGQGIGDPPSVLTENQADCLSGAWVAEQVDEGFGPFSDPSALDNSIGAMLYVRDQPGSDPNAALAHGSGFDRVRAFQDGYEGGVEYCYGYIEDPPFIDESLFSEADLATGGNLPFDEVTDLVIQDLDDFFAENVDGFEGPGDPFDIVPEDELRGPARRGRRRGGGHGVRDALGRAGPGRGRRRRRRRGPPPAAGLPGGLLAG